ncbi:MAG TPA: DUF455 family protein [Kofleriaceae bacterium]|nr:DUF455 family protein [Kofleriaceae bacterium]
MSEPTGTRDAPEPETIEAFARRVVEGTTLEAKLAPPPAGLRPGEAAAAIVLDGPARPAELRVGDVRVPPLAGMADRAQRGRILHALANHELQAAELFAWALLAFAGEPRAFRGGLLAICADEQRHCRRYAARAAALGCAFGSQPVTAHFWNHRARMATPLGFVCTMGLTFENANLDLAGDYAEAARAAGDAETAAILDEVAADEVDHVRFAWTWLEKLAGGRAPEDVYREVATFPLGARRARGARLDVERRRRAGLSEAMIALLAEAAPVRPGGGPRS